LRQQEKKFIIGWDIPELGFSESQNILTPYTLSELGVDKRKETGQLIESSLNPKSTCFVTKVSKYIIEIEK